MPDEEDDGYAECDGEDEPETDCAIDSDGNCGAAGSEYCEFECPYREEINN